MEGYISRETFKEQLKYYSIPNHCHEGLERYVYNKIEPGSFLVAVLSNNLKQSCQRADDINKYHLFNYVNFLYNIVPADCWGSPEKVKAWLQRS